MPRRLVGIVRIIHFDGVAVERNIEGEHFRMVLAQVLTVERRKRTTFLGTTGETHGFSRIESGAARFDRPGCGYASTISRTLTLGLVCASTFSQ